MAYKTSREGQHGLKCLTCEATNSDPRAWDQSEPFCPDCQDNGKEEAYLAQASALGREGER